MIPCLRVTSAAKTLHAQLGASQTSTHHPLSLQLPLWVALQKTENQRARIHGHAANARRDGGVHDVVERLLAVKPLPKPHVVGVTLERMAASQALAQEDSEGPPVNGFGVRSAKKHLGLRLTPRQRAHRHVLLRATVAVAPQLADGSLQLAAKTVVAGQAEVGELDVPIGSEQHVLRLQVSLR